jgi:DnaJ-class molecular chaperone
MANDHYATLGISRSASDEEIRKAYRTLARKYHPDLHPDDATAKKKFQEVQDAFDVLSDEKKRSMYDRYGAGFEQMGGSGRPGAGPQWRPGAGGQGVEFDLNDLFGGGAAAAGGGGFADLFKQFTRGGGGATRQAAPQRGQDIAHEITVPFSTAVLGGEAAISLQRVDGKVEALTVKIPAGIEDGKRIRLRGQGEQPPGGQPAGDLLLTVHVAPHPSYTRRGKRLDIVVPISLAEALRGTKVAIPAPRGTITLTIPPGTSSGKKLRVKGQGIAPAGQEPGDLFAEVQIVLPADLADDVREQIAQLVDSSPSNPRRDLRW